MCTMDGSSIEIANEIGIENVYLNVIFCSYSFAFGPTFADQEKGLYSVSVIPYTLESVFDYLQSGRIVTIEEARFIIQPLRNGDYFRVCADFEDYCRVQKEMEELWKNEREWTRRSIMTVAGMGKFSSDNA